MTYPTRLAGVMTLAIACMPLTAPTFGGDPAPEYEYAMFVLSGFGGTWDRAFAINSAGDIVGESFLSGDATFHATLWLNGGRDGQVSDLGTLGGAWSAAWDINDQREIVGRSTRAGGGSFDDHAFLWRDGEMSDLGWLSGGEDYTQAWSINNKGQIVGQSYAYAFLWEDGLMTELPGFHGHSARAKDINENGQIVGNSSVPENGFHAMIWENGEIRDLGTLGGSQSWAEAINDLRIIVGQADYREPRKPHAAVWDGTNVYDIHMISTKPFSSAWGINNQNAIVGNVGNNQLSSEGFIFRLGRGMELLNELVAPGSGIGIETAFDINDNGQIAATGHERTPDQPKRALLLSPVSPEMSLSDPVPGVAGKMNRWSITGAQPTSRITFLYGLKGGGTYVPDCDVLDAAIQINHPKVLGTAIADAEGNASIDRLVPSVAANRKGILFQAVSVKDCEESQLVVFSFE